MYLHPPIKLLTKADQQINQLMKYDEQINHLTTADQPTLGEARVDRREVRDERPAKSAGSA